jgi:hypothetical protein
LVRLSLPVETLGASRAQLEDLRLLDPQGREVPYLTEQAAPAEKTVRPAKSFQVTLTATATVITLETGLAQPLEGVTLATPAASFIKGVRIEGATDQANWRTLTQGAPIFRQTTGPAHLHVPLPPGVWPFLRLTVDDRRSEPIPFSGAQVHAAAPDTPSEALPAVIAERIESPGQSRLALNLPAANLRLASLQLEVADPLFTREVTVAARQLAENEVKEFTLASGTVYRLALEGQPVSASLAVTVEAQAPSHELVLLIRNYDSPPLQITAVRATRRPVYLIFHAAQAGAYQLLTGNPRCAAPRYDLAELAASLRGAVVLELAPAPLAANPAYRPPEALPAVPDVGASLDPSAWKYRKAVRVKAPGEQQLELDLDLLARAQPAFEDLRLLRAENQVPFIHEHTSITRALTPVVAAANDPKRPKLSRWSLRLPQRRLPVTGLLCASPTPLFRRELTLSEELADERGAKYTRTLGQATWTQTPEQPSRQFTLALATPPESDALFLETDNGDNQSIALQNFQLLYPAHRILFKTATPGGLYLYYGNSRAGSPQYDLSLVAGQLLAAEKLAAALGPEEQLKKATWREQFGSAGSAGVVFWAVLVAVVVGLLLVIVRLLPTQKDTAQGNRNQKTN